jgi:molybdate transport system substrate-binding protein
MVRRRLPALSLSLLVLFCTFLLGACRDSEPAAGEELAVFAAASLTNVFQDVSAAFEAEHPGVKVRLNLAGSHQLAQQIAHDAPADVFASADSAQMAVAVGTGRIAPESVHTFAANRLVIIVPPDNEADVTTVDDLVRPGLRLVLAGETVPAGAYTRLFLTQLADSGAVQDDYEGAVLGNVVSYEQNVRAVLTKVALGEADAGIVYETDALAEDVLQLAIPEALNVVATYPIAPLADSQQPAAAGAFIDYILSPAGQAILESHGFFPVPEPEDSP